MSKQRKRLSDRILAAALSVSLVTCFTPVSVFAVAEETSVPVEVKDLTEEKPSETVAEEGTEESDTPERKEYRVHFNTAEEIRDKVKIFLNDNEIDEINAVPDEEITFGLDVLSDDNQLYRIGSVKIGENNLFEDELNGKESYQGKFTLTKEMTDNADDEGNIEISVEVIQVYNVNFKFDSSMGRIVRADDENQEIGTVVLNQDEGYSFTAVPEENYCVAEIIVDGNSETYSENDNRITKELDPNQNHDVTVMFALNRYKVSLDDATENGSVKIYTESVDYGGKTDVVITPEEDYYIKDITVNGEKPEKFNIREHKLTLDNVTEDKVIHVDFSKIPVTGKKDFSLNLDDTISKNGKEYVFSKNKKVTFTTEKDGMRLIMGDGAYKGDEATKSITLDSGTPVTVKYVELYYAYSEFAEKEWHTIPLNKEITFYEGTKPEIILPELSGNLNSYNSDVKISLNVPIPEGYPKLSKIEYWINGEEKTPIKGTEKMEIVVPAMQYDRKTLKVKVRTTDEDGNVQEALSEEFIINSTVPKAKVTIDGKTASGAKEGHYREGRKAVVKIGDWSKTFNQDINTFRILKDGKELSAEEKSKMILWYTSGNILTAEIMFSESGEYEWSFLYNNLSGLHNIGTYSEKGESIYHFVIDNNEMPTGKIKADEKVWDTLADVLSFGIFRKSEIKVTIDGLSDGVSGIREVSYFVDVQNERLSDISDKVKSFDVLENLYKSTNSPFKVYEGEFEIPANTKAVVYARIMDNAGNIVYINSDGLIVDNCPPEIISIDTASGVTDDRTGRKIIGGKALFSVSVRDIVPENREAFSGINRIYWVVERNGERIGGENELYRWSADDEKALREEWSGDFVFNPYKIAGYNQDNIYIKVIVDDNAGNSYSKDYYFSVNTDDPIAEVMFIDEERKVQALNYDYFTSRRATVTIMNDRESSFDEEAANQAIISAISAVDGKGNPIAEDSGDLVTVSSWKKNADNSYTAFVNFNYDGNYTWRNTVYTNGAGKSTSLLETGSMSFTIDKTDPTGKVSVRDNAINSIMDVLTFGWWSSGSYTVTLDYDDETSPVQAYYYISRDGKTIDTKTLDSLAEEKWNMYSDLMPIEIDDEDDYTIYFKVVDGAGNYIYVSSDKNIIIDRSAPSVEIHAENPFTEIEGKFVYNSSYEEGIPIDIIVNDGNNSSGLGLVEYWIEMDGNEVEGSKETLFEMSDSKVDGFYKNITVIPEKYNSSNVVLYVQAVDNVGNSYTNSIALDIDTTAPEISVSYGSDVGFRGSNCFGNTRRATITIKERGKHFDENAATNGISVTAVDNDGKTVDDAYTISNWKTERGDTPDECKHIVTVTYWEDAKYTFNISYTDVAGNRANGINSEGSNMPYRFTIDRIAPSGEINANGLKWNNSIKKFEDASVNFDVFKNSALEFGIIGSDELSGVKEIAYLVYDYKENFANMSEPQLKYSELEEIYNSEESPFIKIESGEKFRISPKKKAVVYARITDKAGNFTYIASGGAIIDDRDPRVFLVIPSIWNSEKEFNEIQNEPVTFTVGVDENVRGNEAFSGINRVYYTVYDKDGNVITEKNIYKWSAKEGKLCDRWDGEFTIDAKDDDRYNIDNLRIDVTVVDNAGNEFIYPGDEFSMNVDELSTEVTFEDEQNENCTDENYFTSRKATVTISNDRESSFYPKAAEEAIREAISATGITDRSGNVFGKQPDDLVTIEWEEYEEGSNVHTATVYFNYCGNYEWKKTEYTNKAGNSKELIDVDVIDFTIDSVSPFGSIVIEENVWVDLLSTLTFGLYSNDKYKVSVEMYDFTSGASAEYYISHDTVIHDAAFLDSVTEWQKYKGTFEISDPDKYVIYLKITDKAGNYNYICSDGHIIDSSKPDIVLTPESPVIGKDGTPVYNGKYSDGISIDVLVTESEPYSGLKSVEYWITADGEETQRENLFLFGNDSPEYGDLVSRFEGNITVDTELNNSSDVVVNVKAVDNADNVYTESIKLDIDVTAPVISVSYDNNDDNGGNTYFDRVRTATVSITERADHFDKKTATENIEITAVDVKGKDVEDAFVISDWVTVEGATPDEDTHTATILYRADANYNFSVSYTDRAQNSNEGINTGDSVAPYTFTVDTTKPTGTVTASADGREITWDELAEILRFGFWSNTGIRITGTSDDPTSPVSSVQYYKTSSRDSGNIGVPLTESDLDSVKSWQDFDGLNGIDIQQNEQLVIYLRIVDKAGNTKYISTDGLIVDSESPHEEFTAPEIDVTPEQTASGIYNGNVPIKINVADPLNGGAYSGISEVRYTVFNMGVETQTGTLYSFGDDYPTQDGLLRTWEGEIIVDSNLNNSNDVVIEVYAVDNARNGSSERTSVKIDVTPPQINVSYDNNTSNGELFRNSRTAVVSVTERNFEEEYITILVNGQRYNVTGWTASGGTGNGDDTVWTASVPFGTDGDYTFSIEGTDLAANKNTEVDFGKSTHPTKFTIDGTKPSINVEFIEEKNDHIGNYYQKPRTARITIDELHFDSDAATRGVSCSIVTDEHDKNAGASAVLSEWSQIEGTNSYFATMNMKSDAMYNFSVQYADMAGNDGNSYQTEFYIDNKNPELSVAVNDSESRGAYSGEVRPAIHYDDTNFDENNVEISMSGVNVDVSDCSTDGEDISFTLENADGEIIEWHGKIENVVQNDRIYGKEISLENFPEGKELKNFDDIYTMNVSLTDKSGRTSSKELAFSVNRFGSTYDITKIKDILGTYSKVSPEIVISEINPDELKKYSVTLFKNNETITLRENSDYTVEVIGNKNEWHEYVYRIPAKNFTDDGIYNITIHSVDSAGNVSENTLDTKDSTISFVVDNTPPKVIVANIENGEIYSEESRRVIMTVDDNILLSSVAVYLDNSKEALRVWSAAEIAQILGNENSDERVFDFEISGDSTDAHTLKVVCTDAAGNPTEIEYKNFRVTTDKLTLYRNNKPVFFSTVAGLLLLIGGGVFVVTRRRKRYN